jgi:hypothetical protein
MPRHSEAWDGGDGGWRGPLDAERAGGPRVKVRGAYVVAKNAAGPPVAFIEVAPTIHGAIHGAIMRPPFAPACSPRPAHANPHPVRIRLCRARFGTARACQRTTLQRQGGHRNQVCAVRGHDACRWRVACRPIPRHPACRPAAHPPPPGMPAPTTAPGAPPPPPTLPHSPPATAPPHDPTRVRVRGGALGAVRWGARCGWGGVGRRVRVQGGAPGAGHMAHTRPPRALRRAARSRPCVQQHARATNAPRPHQS